MQNFKDGRCLFAQLFFVAYLWLILYEIYSVWIVPNGQNHLLVLKVPRSGSSWLTSQLNSLPRVYISKEIIQRKDFSQYDRFQLQNHLKMAFTQPTDKISFSNSIVPSGRFVEDFILHPVSKWFRLSVLGATVNPEYLDGIAWNTILSSSIPVNIVAYYRKNFVKSIISDITGKYVKSRCGSANVPYNNKIRCEYPQQWRINITLFMHLLDKWEGRYRGYSLYIQNQKLQTKSNWKIIFLTYEELQKNSTQSLQKILKFPTNTKYVVPVGFVSLAGWKKRGNDNLSEFIANLPDVIRHFKKHQACDMLVNLLNENFSDDALPASYDPLDLSFLDSIRYCIKAFDD